MAIFDKSEKIFFIIIDRFGKTTNGTHYATIESAEESAKIMALDNQGCEFLVCQVVSSHKVM